jgi:cell wall-associated NlpC family hydrolase
MMITLKRLSAVLLFLALSSTVVATRQMPASSATTDEVEEALGAYENRLTPLVEAIGEFHGSQKDHLETVERVSSASASLEAARQRLDENRSRFAALAVYAYMDRGGRGSDAEAGSQRGVALASSRLRSDERDVRDAQKQLDAAVDAARKAASTEGRAQARVTTLEQLAEEPLGNLDQLLKEVAPTLPGAALSAYRRASSTLKETDARCEVPAALLVGIGRIMSNHGRAAGSQLQTGGLTSDLLIGLIGTPSADTDGGQIDLSAVVDSRVGPLQILPARWLEFVPVGVIESSPEWLYSSAIVAGRVLCSASKELTSNEGVHRALNAFTKNASLTEAILGSARQIARTTDIGLGTIPIDPRVTSALEYLKTSQFDSESVESARATLIAWSQLRLGTPYSQCLGADIRPEDPECPPGTNRFGKGFFDCSGYLSTAFASIGIAIPTTTYAMLLDEGFGQFKVGDEYVQESDLAGDVLLMDGHVALSLGNGSIIHASGGQLTEEPLPAWVRNGVLGVYRPLI